MPEKLIFKIKDNGQKNPHFYNSNIIKGVDCVLPISKSKNNKLLYQGFYKNGKWHHKLHGSLWSKIKYYFNRLINNI